MNVRCWYWKHQVAIDIAIAVLFVLLDTGATLGGNSWWPAQPGTLAWVMLGFQVAANTPTTAKALFVITIVSPTLQGPFAAALAASVGFAALVRGVFARWFAIGSFVAAVVMLPAAFAYRSSGFLYPDVQQQLVGQIFLLWVLVAAILVVRRPAPRPN